MKPTSSLIARIALLAACWLALVGAVQAQSVSILYRFTGSSYEGAINPTSLVLGSDGNFYGTCFYGGIFKITPQGQFTVVSATNISAAYPTGLILASDGNFYGTTLDGGTHTDEGTVFKMTPQGVVTALHSFDDGTVTNDGVNPLAGLIEASDGNLYGTTSGGGAGVGQAGTVFRITKQGVVTILHNFGDGTVANDGAAPNAPLVQGSDGNLYGMTTSGGAKNEGTVFKITPLGVCQTIHSFGGGTVPHDGSYATPPRFASSGSLAFMSGLVQGPDGNFYGTTAGGGATGNGTVFKITPQGTETILYNFNDNSIPYLGAGPVGGLLLAQDGNFYGTTSGTPQSRGAIGSGTIYQMTPQGKVTFLHDFGDGSIVGDGGNPQRALVQGADGNLYGITLSGGLNNEGGTNGTFFKLTLGPPALTSPATVNGTVGSPLSYQGKGTNSPTTFAASSNLPAGLSLNTSTGLITGTPTTAGTTTVTLTLTNSSQSNTASLTFNIAVQPGPTITSTANLYGTVNTPLSYTITASNSPTSFGASTFTGGLAGLSVNSSTGVISGTPTAAGTYQVSLIANNNAGQAVETLNVTIFATPPSLGQEYSVLHRFGVGVTNDGTIPTSALVQGLDGTFYGVTVGGGSGSVGSLFNLASGGAITIVHNYGNGSLFDDGQMPEAIILGSDGNFYGTTNSGGTAGDGTVFKIGPDGTESILHNFGDGSVANDGVNPTAGLVQGSDANFYGVTATGGSASNGVVFQITPQGKETILHSFGDGTALNPDGTAAAADGATPSAVLIQGGDGLFYGTTQGGGSKNEGTLFKMTPTGTVMILHSFGDGTVANDGSSPEAALVQATDGNFYGTTSGGGSKGNGTVFQLTPQGVVTTLHSFGDNTVTNDGTSPQAALIQGFDGSLYGTTYSGGANGTGTVYEITLPTVANPAAATILYSFGTATNDGANPKTPLFQGTDGNFYGTTYGGGVSGNGTVFVIEGSLAPSIAPTIIGATTVYTPVSNPLLYAAQALNSQSGAVSGITASLVKAVTTPASGSSAKAALAFALPSDVTPADTTFSPTRWLLSGDQTPILPPNLAFDSTSGTMSGTAVATPGIYTFSITPKNNFAAGTQRTVTMYIETSPTVTSNVTDTPTQGVPYSYQVQVTDYDFPFSYSATHLPAWLGIDTGAGTLTGTPPSPGTYIFNPIATNLAGSTGLQVTLTVAPTSPNAPVITSATTATGYVGVGFGYQILANNTPTSYSALTLPPGLLFNSLTGQIFGTPTTPGTYLIPISATNASTTYASVLTLTVGPASAPVINSPLSATTTEGSPFSYPIPTSGTVTTYSATGLPAGLSLNPTTGLISGTPSATGVSTVAITAANGAGASTGNLTLTVTLPPLTFSQWEALYPTLTDPAPADTPMGDSVPTLLKYLYDINPTASMSATDRAALPVLGTTTTGTTTYLTLTYRQNAGLSDMTLNVQTSTDLQKWSDDTTPADQPQPTGATDSATGDPYMQIEVPVTGARQFIRLNATQP